MATPSAAEETIEIDLRNPALAALLAWLWPGLGHLYQRRYGKGVLYMVCILSTWFFGLALGEGNSVYASNRTWAQKLMYGCQLGVGVNALPALAKSMNDDHEPGRLIDRPLTERFMALPSENDLHDLSLKLGLRYDMGVLYTMIAGLLNVLAVFDAYGGPFMPAPEDDKKKRRTQDRGQESGIRSQGRARRPDFPQTTMLTHNQIWYLLPLLVSVSLVYGATRHEYLQPILIHSLRSAWWMVSFMFSVFAVLLVLSWLLT